MKDSHTCVSGSSEPRLAAPSLTTSASLVMVLTEDWAAWASFSWLAPAPDTSSLVSSTRTLAVFRIFSLDEQKHVELLAIWIEFHFKSHLGTVFSEQQLILDIIMNNTYHYESKCFRRSEMLENLWSAKVSAFSLLSVPAVANMMVVSRSAIMPATALAAVIQAWVPRLPACSAANTWDTWEREKSFWFYRLHHSNNTLINVWRSKRVNTQTTHKSTQFNITKSKLFPVISVRQPTTTVWWNIRLEGNFHSLSRTLCGRRQWALSWWLNRWDCTAELLPWWPIQCNCSLVLLPAS